MIELTAFLGNPGREYSRNRHNAGFMLTEKLCFKTNLSWQKKFSGFYAVMEKSCLAEFVNDAPPLLPSEAGKRLHFIKPETYMNLSGKSVSKVTSFFKIKSDAVLVVHDELELPLGTLSLKFGGGLGGHNGLRSMKEYLGTADFWRIRIGIGRPKGVNGGGNDESIVNWVLSNFSLQETEILDTVLESGAELLCRILTTSAEKLLDEWAKKKIL